MSKKNLNMWERVKLVTNNPYQFLLHICPQYVLNKLCDETFLKLKYHAKLGKALNLECPQTFNEKLQWLKLYDRRPEYIMMVDKYAVKQYVAKKVGKEYVIPNLGVWDSFDKIDFNCLPDQFVLKCTHDSGGLVICKDKSKLDIKKTKKKIEKSLKRNYYYTGREWPYKNVLPRIIAEQYIGDGSGAGLNDYKLMCFNGKVKCSFVCSNRYSPAGLCVTFFDRNWNLMPFKRHYPADTRGFPKPKNYEKMVYLAETLAEEIPFVRVDFYEVQGRIFFGELTFYPGNGYEEFTPDKWDYELGKWLKLPPKNKIL